MAFKFIEGKGWIGWGYFAGPSGSSRWYRVVGPLRLTYDQCSGMDYLLPCVTCALPGMDVPFRGAFSLERKKVYTEIYEDLKPPQGLSQRTLGQTKRKR